MAVRSGENLSFDSPPRGASKTIVKHHVNLRSQQLEDYNKTSSLAKAVKSQTDRVTLTVKAAAALASRLNEHDHSSSGNNIRTPQDQDLYSAAKSDFTDRPSENNKIERDYGLGQDHHYIRPDRNVPANSATEELKVRQEEPTRNPTLDGSIPPAGAPINSGEVNDEIFSKRGGAQTVGHATPGQSAKPFDELKPTASNESTIPDPKEASGSSRTTQNTNTKCNGDERAQIPTTIKVRPGSNHARSTGGFDVFYQRAQEDPPISSQLPSSSIPYKAETRCENQSNNAGMDLNTDVYSSAFPNEKVLKRSLSEEDEVPEGVDLNIFRSPKAARLLTGLRKKSDDSMQRSKTTDEKSKEDVEETTANQARRNESDIQSRIGSKLSDEVTEDFHPMRESRVPSSRLGRLWEYGGLATSMAFGAVGESFRRATGTSPPGSSLMLSASNMDLLVAKLSRMRGAALKLGQMMSFQDSKMLPGPIHEILLRVQDHADYMPPYQRDRVLSDNLGSDWRSIFSSFDELPIAAASIGQVHRAQLAEDGTEVAVKVQYPGVADSISSDLSNLSVLLTASRLLPKGLYLEKTIANARIELAWECDYVREAECQAKFQKLIQDESDTFMVPTVVPAASGKQVLTAEFMHGTAVTKQSLHLSQEQRDWIGSNILRLCLRELVEFKFMQTDPNWTNFLFNPINRKIELLDFGASRDYPDEFVDPYIGILIAASKGDRGTIENLSIKLGYLTGHESQTMVNAHVTSVLTLAEPFRETRSSHEIYDFRDQTITDRVRGLIPVMVRERLSPPPEETYSLHRKLSGAFLLLAKLGSRVECRRLFDEAIEKWEGGGSPRRVD